jgi:hypothetical protein
MSSSTATGTPSSDATRPMLRPPCSILLEIREVRELAEPSHAGRETQFSDGQRFDND